MNIIAVHELYNNYKGMEIVPKRKLNYETELQKIKTERKTINDI